MADSLRNAIANDPTLVNNWPNWTNDQHKNVNGELVSFLLAKANNPGPVHHKPPWPYAADLMKALEYVAPDVGVAVSQDPGTFQFDQPSH